MENEIIICAGCGSQVEEYGYCEKTDKGYGQCCWDEHTQQCSLCQELAQN